MFVLLLMPKAVNRVQFHYKHYQNQKPFNRLTAVRYQFLGKIMALLMKKSAMSKSKYLDQPGETKGLNPDLKSRHLLSAIDLEKRTAICSTCGTTEIVVIRNGKHPHWSPVVYCRAKMREKNRVALRRYRAKKRSQDPNWKPKHKVSVINDEKMTGVCAVCGPTDIKKYIYKQKYTVYLCATRLRKQAREYSRSHYKSATKTQVV